MRPILDVIGRSRRSILDSSEQMIPTGYNLVTVTLICHLIFFSQVHIIFACKVYFFFFALLKMSFGHVDSHRAIILQLVQLSFSDVEHTLLQIEHDQNHETRLQNTHDFTHMKLTQHRNYK